MPVAVQVLLLVVVAALIAVVAALTVLRRGHPRLAAPPVAESGVRAADRVAVPNPPVAVAPAGSVDDSRQRLDAELATLRAKVEEELGTQRAECERTVAAETARAARLRSDAEEEVRALRSDLRGQRQDIERREQRIAEREQRLEAEAQRLADRSVELDGRHAELEQRQVELAGAEAERLAALERVAGLSADDARAELVASIESDAKRHAALTVRDIEHAAQQEGEARARRILTTTIQRLATEQTSESVVSVLHLPSDDMKGRIIGREGRNIRAFEQVTGVNVIIDDTPEAVLLSCFDPVRREVARVTLENLVLDGRIHPHRIEEVYERSKASVDEMCQRAGEDAVVEVGITDIHPELVHTLGTLRYRTSYGQNVLKHLLECAQLAGLMAAELGLDRALCKRCALLHDIGKALTHEVEGSHALVGADLARRYGESDDVVHAIEAHHNEVEPRTVEAVLTQAADAISGGRPGARRESLESYVKRLERLEEIARGHDGVDKVYAMQAGREVRVMVLPDQVDDIGAQVLARDIVKQVEEELTYPGQIRVTVIRESRATETAR